eukprot:3792528-Rhodomonas_salina.1
MQKFANGQGQARLAALRVQDDEASQDHAGGGAGLHWDEAVRAETSGARSGVSTDRHPQPPQDYPGAGTSAACAVLV